MAHEPKYLPKEFPTEAAQHVIDYLLGRNPDICCVVDCCYGLVGYGLYQLTSGACPHSANAHVPVTKEAKAEALKPLTAKQGSAPAGINWSSIVLLIMEILQELLQQPVPLVEGKSPA